MRRKEKFSIDHTFYLSRFLFNMFRFKTISSLLIFAAAVLVFFVFLLHFFAPSYQYPDNTINHSDQPISGFPFLRQHWIKAQPTAIVSIPVELNRDITLPITKCR